MIVIERTVDISRPVQTETLRGSEFTGEQLAHTFKIHVTNNGVAVPLTGSVTARFFQANGASLLLAETCGLEDGAAVVTLVKACYDIPGRFALAIYHTADNAVTCIYSAVGSVTNVIGNPEYDPGNVIGDISTLIATANQAAEGAERALADASNIVSYADQSSESHTDAEKARARANIGAINADLNTGITGMVDYGALDQKQTSSSYGITVTTHPNYIKLNGTGTGTYGKRWRLYSTLVGYNGSHRGEYSQSSGAVLMAGHTYELRARIIRGSVAEGSGFTFSAYKVGTSVDLLVAIPRNDPLYEKTFRFTLSTDTEVCLFVSYVKDASFTNCEMIYWIEDVTNGIRRLPPPTADGTYTFKVTVTDGVPTYSWVADGASLMSVSPMLTTPLNSEDNPEETTEETPDEPTGEEER